PVPTVTYPPSFFSMTPPPPISTLFPYTTLFRSSPIKIDYVKLRNTSSQFEQILDNNPFLRRSFEQQFIAGLMYSFTYNGLSNSRSEEHTSELQSRFDLVCRLLLEKKND